MLFRLVAHLCPPCIPILIHFTDIVTSLTKEKGRRMYIMTLPAGSHTVLRHDSWREVTVSSAGRLVFAVGRPNIVVDV